jgi:hypothetical protein
MIAILPINESKTPQIIQHFPISELLKDEKGM